MGALRLSAEHVTVFDDEDWPTDHRDGDTMNNRRANLRKATRSQNAANSKPRRPGHFRGVYHRRLSRGDVWRAIIQGRGKVCHLGNFATPEDAARAYDAAAIARYGEFAVLNFPRES